MPDLGIDVLYTVFSCPKLGFTKHLTFLLVKIMSDFNLHFLRKFVIFSLFFGHFFFSCELPVYSFCPFFF